MGIKQLFGFGKEEEETIEKGTIEKGTIEKGTAQEIIDSCKRPQPKQSIITDKDNPIFNDIKLKLSIEQIK